MALNFDQFLAAASGTSANAAVAAQLGLASLEVRREPEALPLVEAAAQRAPNDAAVHHVLGLIHRELGDLEPALAAFDRALLSNPEGPRLVHARARTSFEAGLPSLDWYDRARRLAPLDGEVILGQAAALIAEEQAAEADRIVAAMLAEHPGWTAGHAGLARMRFAAGRREDFLESIDQALTSAPRDPRLWELRAVILLRALDHVALADTLAAARRALGDAPFLAGLEAIAATERGDIAAADHAFAALDPLGAVDIGLYWLRHLLRRGEPDKVIEETARIPREWRKQAWPYLFLARRLSGDPRATLAAIDPLIRVVDLDISADELTALGECLRRLHLARAQPLDQSVRGGTQTDGPLLKRIEPPIRAIARKLTQEVRSYREAMPSALPDDPIAESPRHPRFIGSWSVRFLGGGGHHDAHIHDAGWLSSAFYVALPERSMEEKAGWLTLGAPQESLGLALPALRMVEPKAGRLVLFPSMLWHGTMPFASGERLTIAFDAG